MAAIMLVDPNGEAAWWQWLAGAAIVATCITITALTGGAGAAVVLGITIAIGAADGTISAAISGGDPLDGRFIRRGWWCYRGMVRGLAGRAISSAIYDFGYEYLIFQEHENEKALFYSIVIVVNNSQPIIM